MKLPPLTQPAATSLSSWPEIASPYWQIGWGAIRRSIPPIAAISPASAPLYLHIAGLYRTMQIIDGAPALIAI